jgi:ATP-dependent Clp protease adaptor protein ClpS
MDSALEGRSMMTTTPRHEELSGVEVLVDRPWNVVVWNDPVNLMSYVVYVFRKLFGFPKEKATRLMLQVHNEGRAIVATEPRERAEMDCYRLHRHGLWATMEKS